MTSLMQERIIAQISKPPAQRNTHELDVLLPWLRKKSELLRDLDRHVLLEVVRNCDHLRGEKDDVIITQGDDGDRLYIILSGTVSVYIDGKKTGESGENDAETIENVEQRVQRAPSIADEKAQRLEMAVLGIGKGNLEDVKEEDSATVSSPDADTSQVAVQGKATKRSKYGRFVVKFESGKCFGEIALISRESKRNATIIADDVCSFLVIKRYLYNTTLKAYQEQEYAERAAFVKTHPLFRNWHPKFLKLLEMSLIKETHGYDCNIVKQGDEWKGLYFIIKGNTKLMIEPARHEAQYPDLKPFKSYNDIFELELGRSIFLCNVGAGEMFGDVEIVMNLPEYHHSIVCTCETEVYCLNNKNFERFIAKKYPNALDTLRLHVETKLKNRSHSVQGTHVPLLRHLYFKMTEELKPVVREIPPLRGSKELPDKSVLFDHLVEAFKSNRAELCNPVVPGSIYLREIMRQKARIRDTQRKRKWEELKVKRKRITRAPVPDKPRTTKELKAALKRQREEDEERERKELLREVRLREEEEMKKMEMNTVNLKNFVVQFQDPVLLAQEGLNANNNSGLEKERTFITELEKSRPPSKVEMEIQSVPEPRRQVRKLNIPKKSQSMMDFKTAKSEEELFEEISEDGESIFEAVGREQAESMAESRMKFVTELVKRGVEIPENPSYRDWETSDRSMRYLEQRIKRFMDKTGDPDESPYAPRLSRFEVKDEMEKVPRPGGRVIVKPRACAERKHDEKKGQLSDHEHYSYNIVPSIPNYEKLRKTKMLVQMSLDDKREKWMHTNPTN